MSNRRIREQLKFKLFAARKHDLPMPRNCNDRLYPQDIDEHIDQELDSFYEWLVQKYWDEHT